MYDLVIRGGLVVDGTGLPARRADVAVSGGRIRQVGRVGERGSREIDADGHIVTPGFVDGHTHLDALYERSDLDAVLAKVEANARAADETASAEMKRAG